MCRQFSNAEDTMAFIEKAFDDWKVKHVSVFEDGVFHTCYKINPRIVRGLVALAQKMRQQKYGLYGNYKNR